MADSRSDKEKSGLEPPAGSFPEEIRPGDTVVEEGLAIHIMEPDDPGTIFVAVAEPTDDLGEPLASGDIGDAVFEAVPEDIPVTVDIPRYGDLAEVVAVRLRGLGPALFFLSGGASYAAEDNVIVPMEEGHVYGTVASVLRVAADHLSSLNGEGEGSGALRPVVRKATEKDDTAAAGNDALASEALQYCRQCIRERDLDMKLVDVLVLHDRGKMVFYFTAPARIDFRELVKDLVRRYRTRIELRQIGVRHETQMVGALGNCGMVCCCRRYLRTFAPVAIKMAKEQNVFLNPVKISGICGRLLCCLAYEQEHYDDFYRSCPKLGKKYHTDSGVFRILRASLFRESVTVLSETGEEIEYPLADWNAMNPFRPGAQQGSNVGRKQEGRPAGEEKPRKNGKPEKKHREPASGDLPEESPEAVIGGKISAGNIPAENIPAENIPADEPERESGFDDADDSGDTDGGSIFGLSPRRDSSGENTGGEAPGKRKRPPRRHHRKKQQADS